MTPSAIRHTSHPPSSSARLPLIYIALLAAVTMSASAIPLVATNGTTLARFDSSSPGTVTTVSITGMQAGETLVGIDYDPVSGALYGVGTTNRLYTLNPVTGAATQVGTGNGFTLAGTAFGTDFDPFFGTIRQVSNTEQNLRINRNTATTSSVDPNLSPSGNVVAVAYTNNFSGTGASTLFGIDSAAGTLVRIGNAAGTPSSQDTGVITTIGSLGLGTNLNEAIGFDIFSNATPFATITVGGVSRLYSVNLGTGAAIPIGIIGNGSTPYLGVAAVLQEAPAATAYGVTANGVLFRFPTRIASTVTTIGSLGIVTEAIDFRPGTSELYGLDVGPNTTQLYKINLTTAALTPVGPGFPSQLVGQPSGNYSLLSSGIGFDFNPRSLQADGSMRIRVVASNGTNLQLNSDTGVIASVDEPLAFAAGDTNSGTPSVDAVAYINSATSTGPADGTTLLYDFDPSKDDLLIQNPPNDGTLTTVSQNPINFDPGVGFDIYTDPTSTDDTIGGDHGFAVLQRIGDANYMFYDVILGSGAIANGRTVGGGLTFDGGLAIIPATQFRFSSATYSVNESGGSITTTVQRLGDNTAAASVTVGTSLGSATAGSDYVSTSTTLNFAAGQTSKTFIVPISNDPAVEGDETFAVVLSGPVQGAFLVAPSTAVVTIVDNDTVGISLSSLTYSADFDNPPGRRVRIGSTVPWEYVVRNTGTVSLSGVTVTDDNGTPADPADDFSPAFMNGDADGNGLLDQGEIWTYAASRIAAPGEFGHTATASGTPVGGGATLTVTDPEFQVGFTPTLLANISTRLRVETGDRLLFGGFIISPGEDKRVMVRAIGPSEDVPGALADPSLEIYNSEGGLIAQNNNWQDAPNRQAIIDSTIAPADDRESAFLGTLAPGAYTAIVFGAGDTTGIGLVEVYDLDNTVSADLVNLATRGFVQTGSDVLIGGFIITGPEQRALLLRGIGPSLTFGGKLEDPTLELFNANGDSLAFNNNWRDSQEADIDDTKIAPTNDAEPAIRTGLTAGNYTAILRGANDSTGIGVVEIYDLD